MGCRGFRLLTFWFVNVLLCRRFDLSMFWFVDVLVCQCLDLSTFRFVDVSVCRRFGCRRFGFSTFWPVAEQTYSNRVDQLPSRRIQTGLSIKPGLYSIRAYARAYADCRRSCWYFCRRLRPACGAYAPGIRAHTPTVAVKVQTCWTFKASADQRRHSSQSRKRSKVTEGRCVVLHWCRGPNASNPTRGRTLPGQERPSNGRPDASQRRPGSMLCPVGLPGALSVDILALLLYWPT